MSKQTSPLQTHSSMNIINTTPQNKINRDKNSSNQSEETSSQNKTESEVPIYNEEYTNEKNNLQQYYINKADYIANELKHNIIPEIDSGHLAIKCWNCDNVNLVKGNLKNIKCSICQQINKIPKPIHKFDEILDYLRAAQLRNFGDEKKTIDGLLRDLKMMIFYYLLLKIKEKKKIIINMVKGKKWNFLKKKFLDFLIFFSLILCFILVFILLILFLLCIMNILILMMNI